VLDKKLLGYFKTFRGIYDIKAQPELTPEMLL
jgi:hypothetical protein